MNKLKIGIIGYGFVGQAVEYSFMTPNVESFVVDPKYSGNSLEELYGFCPDVTFICLPTPSRDDGSINATLVKNTVNEVYENCDTLILIKSTVTPDIVNSIVENRPTVGYVPEFLSEGNAKMDIINASHNVVGANYPELADEIDYIYKTYSMCNPSELVVVKPSEASFVKYVINTFLAMKTSYFNEVYELCNSYGVPYQQVMRGVLADPRIGFSHTKVPGPDGKKGFGGACFPKDLNAFIHFAENNDTNLELLKSVKSVNNQTRAQYETDDREKSNNIKFGID